MRMQGIGVCAAAWVAVLATACAGGPAPAVKAAAGKGGAVAVTFVVKAPESTPADARIYLASNAGEWKPGDPRFALAKGPDGLWTGTFDLEPGFNLEYKFTRGDWDRVEKGPDGTEIANRTFLVPASGETARVEAAVASWRDQVSGAGRPSSVVGKLVIIDNFELGALGVRRTLRIWLPPDYDRAERRYPVLYMHDGQNLFDAATSYAGEWKVDETLTAFASRDPGTGRPFAAIVVGIDNGGGQRLNEYSPFKDPSSPEPRGDRYVESLVRDLKPWVDSNYRTLADRENTWIAGSSMGGLISLYAVWAHPETFSKALCFSSALMFGESSMLRLVKKEGAAKDISVYLDVGGRELGDADRSRAFAEDSRLMYEALGAAGLPESALRFVLDPEAPHNEGAWSRRFPAAYAWMAGLAAP